MFTLRSHHTEAFDQDIRRRFENRMVAHVNQFFPEKCNALGEEGVRSWIAHGIEKAGSYGIITERDVCKYIDIMFVYGRDFDTDPQCGWAPPILKANAVQSADKANYLFETAKKHTATGIRTDG